MKRMDSVDLEQLRTFVSPEIFEFLTAGSGLTEPPNATPTEAEQTNEPLEAKLVANLLEVMLDALLLVCSDMCEMNAETEPSVKRPRLKSDHESSQLSATTFKCSFATPKTQQEMCKAKLSAIAASRFGISSVVTGW